MILPFSIKSSGSSERNSPPLQIGARAMTDTSASGTSRKRTTCGDNEPPPKRTQDSTTRNTVLFLCCLKPWKAILRLPVKNHISVTEVQEALEKQGEHVPSFPLGEFEMISTNPTVQVGIFRHDNAVGCSKNDNSKSHKDLPLPDKNPKDLVHEPKLRVGHCFLHGVDCYPYSVVGSRILIDTSLAPPRRRYRGYRGYRGYG